MLLLLSMFRLTLIYGRMLTAILGSSVCVLAGCGYNGKVATAPAPARFAYTANQGASLSGYAINTSTGALTALSGFPIAVGVNPITVAVDPQSRFLLAGDIAANTLHVFAIDTSTGALSEISTSPYATFKEPSAIAVDPSGTHVYVSSQGSNAVGAFALSPTGALTAITGSPFATSGTGAFGDGLVINAAGTFLYVQDAQNIYTYGLNGKTGTLTLAQTVAGPTGAGGLALDPDGLFLYAVGPGTSSIETYSVNASTGLLTAASPSLMVEHDGAYAISVSPSGEFAYTIENNNDLVSYAVSDGVFTPVGGVYAGVYGEKIGIDPSGSFLYVPQACSNCPGGVYNVVNEFSIGKTGALTKIPGSPVGAGTTPWGIAFTTQ